MADAKPWSCIHGAGSKQIFEGPGVFDAFISDGVGSVFFYDSVGEVASTILGMSEGFTGRIDVGAVVQNGLYLVTGGDSTTTALYTPSAA